MSFEKLLNMADSSEKKKDLATETSSEVKWYVVHTYSGYEEKAKKYLEERIRSTKMEDFFSEILVPQENVVEIVKGEKKTSKKRFFVFPEF